MTWGHRSLKILNPNCADKLRRVLGEGWDKGVLEEAANSISELTADFSRIVAKPGWPVSDTTTKILEGVYGRLYREGTTWDPGFREPPGALDRQPEPKVLAASEAMKMSALQFAFGLVVQRTVNELLETFRYYICSPDSFAVGMSKTTLTMGHVRGHKQIRAAHLDALASAVAFFSMGRDVLDHYQRDATAQGLTDSDARNPDYPFNHLPLWAATLWDNLKGGSQSFIQFAGMTVKWPDEEGGSEQPNPLEHYYKVLQLGGKDEFGNTITHVIVDVVDTGEGKRYVRKDELPKPLNCYPSAYDLIEQPASSANSSKEIEQPWARASQLHDTRKSQSFEALSGHFTAGNNASMKANLEEHIDETAPFEAAMEVAMLPGWKKFFGVDRNDRAERKADYIAQINSTKRESFWTRSHQHLEGSHRGDRWLNPTVKEQNAIERLILATAKEVGRDIRAVNNHPKPRRRLPSKPLEPEAAGRAASTANSIADNSMHDSPQHEFERDGSGHVSPCASGGADNSDAEAADPVGVAASSAELQFTGGSSKDPCDCGGDEAEAIESFTADPSDGGGAVGEPSQEGGEHPGADNSTSGECNDSSNDDADSEEDEFAQIDIDLNPGSVQFALDCFNTVSGSTSDWTRHNNDVWLLGLDDGATYSNKGNDVSVRRTPHPLLKRALKALKCKVDPNISFAVEAASPKHAYVRFSDFAGIQYVYVERTRQPTGTDEGGGTMDWSTTMDFRIMSTTLEALSLCSADGDEGVNLGRQSLRKLLAEQNEALGHREGTRTQFKDSDAIFHQGSTYSTGDIRTLIGVVRWYPAVHDTPATGYWASKSYNYDVLKMGSPYVQKAARARRAKGDQSARQSTRATSIGRPAGGKSGGGKRRTRSTPAKKSDEDNPADSDDRQLHGRPGAFTLMVYEVFIVSRKNCPLTLSPHTTVTAR